MNARESLKLVFGSVVVYVVMAACASSQYVPPGDSLGSGSSGSTSGVMGADDSGSGAGAIFDALIDPVAAAKADTTTSGSRLKAKNYVGSDGSKEFTGWHDSMLNVDCYFVAASDGTTRCMPIATLAGFVFSDPGCSQPLVQTSKGCAPATSAYETQTGAGACTAAFYRIFHVGAVYSGALYTGTPANCIAESDAGAASARSAADFYAVGPEAAPSEFVAASVQTDP